MEKYKANMTEKKKKIIIGLTGNIATGKSLVRNRLGELGAYGIDSDELAHRVIKINSPGYLPVLKEFGVEILGPDLEIDRKKLGKIVFSNPVNLKKLELIVHPIIREATEFLINQSKSDVVVVEAIKLLNSPLNDLVDCVWVTTSSRDMQLQRLLETRGMDEEESLIVMGSQTSQDEKVKHATSIIINDGSVHDVFSQVDKYWKEIILEFINHEPLALINPKIKVTDELYAPKVKATIVRATPRHAEDILKFIKSLDKKNKFKKEKDINYFFSDRAYFILHVENNIIGIVGWKIENLITIVDEIWLNMQSFSSIEIVKLFQNIEFNSRELLAEVILIILNPKVLNKLLILEEHGFKIEKLELLQTKSWRTVAKKSVGSNSTIMYKQLSTNNLMSQI